MMGHNFSNVQVTIGIQRYKSNFIFYNNSVVLQSEFYFTSPVTIKDSDDEYQTTDFSMAVAVSTSGDNKPKLTNCSFTVEIKENSVLIPGSSVKEIIGVDSKKLMEDLTDKLSEELIKYMEVIGCKKN